MRNRARATWLAALLPATVSAAWAAGPNILLMMADDLGWNDVGYNGSDIETPTIDQLAAEGRRLDRYYAFAFCTPTRGPHDRPIADPFRADRPNHRPQWSAV